MIDRAQFLQGASLLVVAFGVPRVAAAQSAPAAAALTQVDAWLAIDPQSQVTVFFGKVELGTGVQTAVAQLIADELDVPFNSIQVVQGDTALTPNQGYTAGSQTLTSGALAVRQAAAVARAKLLELGAARLNAPVPACTTADSAVLVMSAPERHRLVRQANRRPSLRSAGFAEIRSSVRNRRSRPAEHRSTGRHPRQDFRIVQLRRRVRVPGMLHGRVICPPAPVRRWRASMNRR